MSGKRNIHVVRDGDEWATRRANSDRITDHHPTQADPIRAARERARRNRVELVIHRSDGKMRDKDSYGHDPCPPRDKKH